MSEREVESYIKGIPTDTISELLSDIYDITGLYAAVSTCSGENIARHGCVNPFCLQRFKDPELFAACAECGRRAAQAVAKSGGILTSRCHRGLVLTSMAVMIGGAPAAIITFNGYVCEPEVMEALEYLLPEEKYRLDAQAMAAAPYMEYSRAQEAMRIITLAAKYLSEAGKHYRAEKELGDSRVRLMAEANAKLAAERRDGRELIRALLSDLGPRNDGETVKVEIKRAGDKLVISMKGDLTGDYVSLADAAVSRFKLYIGGDFTWETVENGLVVAAPRAGNGMEKPTSGVGSGPAEHVAKAKKYVMDNLAGDVSLASVSRALYLSEAYFSKLFKERAGENFSEYLAERRVERARFLLDNTSLSIGGISGMVGFKEPNSFSRLFRAHTGMSPSAYRRRADSGIKNDAQWEDPPTGAA